MHSHEHNPVMCTLNIFSCNSSAHKYHFRMVFGLFRGSDSYLQRINSISWLARWLVGHISLFWLCAFELPPGKELRWFSTFEMQILKFRIKESGVAAWSENLKMLPILFTRKVDRLPYSLDKRNVKGCHRLLDSSDIVSFYSLIWAAKLKSIWVRSDLFINIWPKRNFISSSNLISFQHFEIFSYKRDQPKIIFRISPYDVGWSKANQEYGHWGNLRK